MLSCFFSLHVSIITNMVSELIVFCFLQRYTFICLHNIMPIHQEKEQYGKQLSLPTQSSVIAIKSKTFWLNLLFNAWYTTIWLTRLFLPVEVGESFSPNKVHLTYSWSRKHLSVEQFCKSSQAHQLLRPLQKDKRYHTHTFNLIFLVFYFILKKLTGLLMTVFEHELSCPHATFKRPIERKSIANIKMALQILAVSLSLCCRACNTFKGLKHFAATMQSRQGDPPQHKCPLFSMYNTLSSVKLQP